MNKRFEVAEERGVFEDHRRQFFAVERAIGRKSDIAPECSDNIAVDRRAGLLEAARHLICVNCTRATFPQHRDNDTLTACNTAR
jgi:hypothetical protein